MRIERGLLFGSSFFSCSQEQGALDFSNGSVKKKSPAGSCCLNSQPLEAPLGRPIHSSGEPYANLSSPQCPLPRISRFPPRFRPDVQPVFQSAFTPRRTNPDGRICSGN